MNLSAWAPSLTNSYALIGFTFLILGIVAKTPVVYAKFPKAYLICFLGLATVVIVAMIVSLLGKDTINTTNKETSTAPITTAAQPTNSNVQITNGSGNTVINNTIEYHPSSNEKP